MRIPPGIQSWFAVLALSLAVFLASTAIGLIGLLSHAVFLVGPGITARDLLAPAAAAVVAIIALIAYLALNLNQA